MIRAVIVEDEPLAARFLTALLERTGRVDVVGVARDAPWGMTLCCEKVADAAFIDIRMPGPDGIDLAGQIAQLQKPPLVVFTTGHADRACEAFRLRAVDYLLKPLEFSQVCDSVSRLQDLIEAGEGETVAGQLPAHEDRLPVKCPGDDLIRFIPRWDVIAAICRERRTWIHTSSHEFSTYYTLGDLTAWLGAAFVRISRESLVNLRAIEEVIHYGDRLYQVRLRDRLGTCLVASRSGAVRLAALIRPTVDEVRG